MHGDLESHQKEQQQKNDTILVHYIFFYFPLTCLLEIFSRKTDLPINFDFYNFKYYFYNLFNASM